MYPGKTSIRNRNFEKEMQFKASRSQGAGGQHVNKTNTKIILEFDMNASINLTDEEKQKIYKYLNNKITKDGVLQLSSQESRSQLKNKKLCTEKFYQLLEKATKRPKKRIPTKKPRKAKEKRIQQKKKRSEKKQFRRTDNIF